MIFVRAGGVVGVVGGALQLQSGVKELQNGKLIGGSFDTVDGVGNAVAGTLIISGKVQAGIGVGAAVAVVEGGKDIFVGIREADTKRTIVGTVKLAAGSAMSVELYTGQPVVIVVGGIAYAWGDHL